MVELNFLPFPVMTTDRLCLRQLKKEDAVEIFELRTDIGVNTYLDRPLLTSIDQAEGFIEKINNGINNNEWINWGLTLKDDDKLMGTICFWNFSETKEQADLGYELLPQYQGKGIMQEALKKILDYGFNSLNLQVIQAYTHYQNTKSINLLMRNGFQQESKEKETHHEVIFRLVNPSL